MEKLSLDRNNLKKFGVTMGIAFALIGLIVLFKHMHSPAPVFVISAAFFILGFICPMVLRPVYIIWMRLAGILAFINTRLILMLMFYLIFTPLGVCMRIFGVDLLDRKIDRKRQSYWSKKEKTAFNPFSYERQF